MKPSKLLIAVASILSVIAATLFPLQPARSQSLIKHRFANLPTINQSFTKQPSDTTVKPVNGTASQVVVNPMAQYFSVSLSLNNWQQFINALNFATGKMKASNMPSNEANFIIDSLFSPMGREIASQLNTKIMAIAHKDSVDKGLIK